MLYNKNQVRITNDKKKLVKKGKNWIVASAFVLALAAGGYTVAGQVNADTATKPQAQAVTTTPQKLSVGQNDESKTSGRVPLNGNNVTTNSQQNQNNNRNITQTKSSNSGIKNDELKPNQKLGVNNSSINGNKNLSSEKSKTPRILLQSPNDNSLNNTLGWTNVDPSKPVHHYHLDIYVPSKGNTFKYFYKDNNGNYTDDLLLHDDSILYTNKWLV